MLEVKGHGSLVEANKGSFDVWVVKYNSKGSQLWKKQLGT